jgi:hypothetical protein
MRQIMIISATALAIAAIWGTTVIGGHTPEKSVARESTAIDVKVVDVMEMMKKAKNLPKEQFDAH